MMKSINYWLRNVLGFSKTEANGFPVLVLVVILFFFAPFLFKWFLSNTYTAGAKDKLLLDSLTADLENNSQYFSLDNDENDPVVEENTSIKFKFNPNNASLDSLLLLGFRKEIAQRIIKYRDAGGSFKIKGDLQKIYGLPSAMYNELHPYIELPEERTYPRSFKSNKTEDVKEYEYPKPEKKEVISFDINEADTSQLMLIYGIGPVLSDRIIKYRSLLGGFVRKEQLIEVYGIKDDVFKNLSEKVFILETFNPVKININEDSAKNIAAHPYISYGIANAIYNYRLQHGKYTSKADLLKLHLIDSTKLEEISPYLAL